MARRGKVVEEVIVDPSEWILMNAFAEFVLFHKDEIKFMCMFGYTFLHGYKLFSSLPDGAAASYKFVSMIFQCTGGGIIVPILINGIPVPLATDAYPIAIFTSFLIHSNFPIVREILSLSPIFKGGMIILYETMRAFVVCKLTLAAAIAIAPSEFSFAVFGPIFCGTIGGCGGAFLPFNKGLDPIKAGLGQPMVSAFIGATYMHLFLNSSYGAGVIHAEKKAKVCMAAFFILFNLYDTFVINAKPAVKKTKKE